MLKEPTSRDDQSSHEERELTKYKHENKMSPLFGTDPEEETEWR